MAELLRAWRVESGFPHHRHRHRGVLLPALCDYGPWQVCILYDGPLWSKFQLLGYNDKYNDKYWETQYEYEC